MALLPSPSAVLDLTRYAAGQVVETVAAVATVPVRVLSLLGQTELMVSRMAVLTERAELLIDRVERVTAEAEQAVGGVKPIMQEVERITTDAEGIVRSAGATSEAAAQVVVQATTISATAKQLLDSYVPMLQRAAPLLGRFVGDLTTEEVTAAIRMVDQLPALRKHLTEDVMPLLGKLDQVGPDLHSLLEVTNDLHLAIVGMPGLKLLRRRGAERVAEENDADGR